MHRLTKHQHQQLDSAGVHHQAVYFATHPPINGQLSSCTQSDSIDNVRILHRAVSDRMSYTPLGDKVTDRRCLHVLLLLLVL
jgi:hypothetical protein